MGRLSARGQCASSTSWSLNLCRSECVVSWVRGIIFEAREGFCGDLFSWYYSCSTMMKKSSFSSYKSPPVNPSSTPPQSEPLPSLPYKHNPTSQIHLEKLLRNPHPYLPPYPSPYPHNTKPPTTTPHTHPPPPGFQRSKTSISTLNRPATLAHTSPACTR